MTILRRSAKQITVMGAPVRASSICCVAARPALVTAASQHKSHVSPITKTKPANGEVHANLAF